MPGERLVQCVALTARHQPRSPPGTQSTSAPGGFAARASRKSRSERRLRYCRAVVPTGSVAASATVSRSARRQTVRARCRTARRGRAAREHEGGQRRQRLVDLVAARLEPGDLLGRRRAGACARAPTGGRSRSSSGTQRSAPRSKRSFWMRPSQASIPSGSGCVRARPSTAPSSSTRAVGRDAQRGLGDAPAVAEAGLAGVAAAGVDAVEPHDGIGHGPSVREASALHAPERVAQRERNRRGRLRRAG